jgi:hypothetical protein
MVHSSMSPQLFEQKPQLSSLIPSTSPTKQIPCALSNLEYLHLIDSKPLAHSSKRHGGVSLFVPFRNSCHTHSCLRSFLFAPDPHPVPNNKPSHVECGGSPPLRPTTPCLPTPIRTTSHPRIFLHAFARPVYASFTLPRDHIDALRFLLDIPKSSANIPMLSV